jgi:hypothetical protein
VDGPKVEREWAVTSDGVAVRRPSELHALLAEGRSLKRAWVEAHAKRQWADRDGEGNRAAAVRLCFRPAYMPPRFAQVTCATDQVAAERLQATRKAARAREFVAKVRGWSALV